MLMIKNLKLLIATLTIIILFVNLVSSYVYLNIYMIKT